MAGEDALLNLAIKLFFQSRFDSGFTLFIGRIEVLCVGDRLHWIYWHLVIPVLFCACVVVVFLAFQVKITRICLVCPLSTSLFRAIASSALLAELDLLFHITYVLWTWESATLLGAKQSALMIFPQLLRLPESVQCTLGQNVDQKAQSRVCRISWVDTLLHFFPSLVQMFYSPGCCGFTVLLSLWHSVANKGMSKMG